MSYTNLRFGEHSLETTQQTPVPINKQLPQQTPIQINKQLPQRTTQQTPVPINKQ